MKKIAILRGINVGGKRKILMKDLKLLCENLGWTNVETYIQSGNLIFNSTEHSSDLENRLEVAIASNFGFEVPVIVRDSKELKSIIEKNPFINDADISQLFLTFLKQKPVNEDQRKLLTYNYEPDKFQLCNKEVFLLCEGKYHKSKLTNNFFEKVLKTTATSRNWKTALKLLELSNK